MSSSEIPQTPPGKPSKVERAKQGSAYLRGTVAQTLTSTATHFEHDDVQVLKFHGVYQQDDRDERHERRDSGDEKAYSFMVRAKIPAGELTASQYLALDELADRHSNNRSLRITTRQGVQLHGVIKDHLKDTLRGLNQALVSTLAACGDVERNIMASPTPYAGERYRRVRELAVELARELCPRTGAYCEIWLDGEKVAGEGAARGAEEPFYGATYLPRKFKTAVALPEDNTVDVFAQDVGLLAVVEGDRLVGANLLAGGGLGLTHAKADTFARLGTPLGFVAAERLVAAVRAVVAIFRDHGHRGDRRHARLKYLLEAWGPERFRAEWEARTGFALEPWREVGPILHPDHLGAHAQGDGRFFYGVFVQNGRVIDGPGGGPRLKTALARIVDRLRPGVRLSPDQNVLLTDLDEASLAEVEATLADHGAARPQDLLPVRRFSLACPALPTCGLALGDAERALPGVLDVLEAELSTLGLDEEPLTVRMTGCPNGCARPYTADLGLVGRGPGVYDLYVGGGLAGDRLAELYDLKVPLEGIAASLRPLLRAWSRERRPEEGLGDYFQRAFGDGRRRTLLTGSKEEPWRERVMEKVATVA
jgi:sulfite reductase beta subunit-like hemoprotein